MPRQHYADVHRQIVKELRIGSIENWWDYEQIASLSPALRLIEGIENRLGELRARLQQSMQAVATSAIAKQTEATRDHTYQLEAIARVIGDTEIGLADFKRTLEYRKYLMYGVYLLLSIALTIVGAFLSHLGVFRVLYEWLKGFLK